MSLPPASNKATENLPLADNRLARRQPAVPAPTKIKSNSLDINLPF